MRVYGSRNAGFGEHLQGLDEALAAFHGRLIHGGGAGPGPRDPAPGAGRRRVLLRRLHSPLLRSGGGRLVRGGKNGRRQGEGRGRAGGGEVKSSKRSTGARWAEWGGGEASFASPTPTRRKLILLTVPPPPVSLLLTLRAWACACCCRALAVVRGGGGVPEERPQRWL